MTKILEVFGGPITKDGIFSFVSNITAEISAADITIDFFTPFSCDFDVPALQKEIGVSSVFCANLQQNDMAKILAIRYLKRILKKGQYDVVHIHGSTQIELAACSFAAKAEKINRIIVHSHSTGEKKGIRYSVIRAMTLPVLNTCPTDYFACSKAAGDWKFSEKTVKQKLQIIKNGIDLSRFKPNDTARISYRKKTGYQETDLVIGHIGRFNYPKNHRFIIDLFAEIKKSNENYKLLLIGDGELKHDTEQYAESKGVLNSICFTGNVNDVQNYLQAMDLFILPSRFEGLPIVGIEAQACGLPVIFSSAVTPEARLTDNVKFIATDNIAAWVKSVEEMIHLPKSDNIEAIKSAGYDMQQTAKQICSVYQSE